jgi:hypothetical protein
LPGLSSLKIKSDETNLFCLKLLKNDEIFQFFFQLYEKIKIIGVGLGLYVYSSCFLTLNFH